MGIVHHARSRPPVSPACACDLGEVSRPAANAGLEPAMRTETAAVEWEGGRVSAVWHAPAHGRTYLVLGHGAGGTMFTPELVKFSEALAGRGIARSGSTSPTRRRGAARRTGSLSWKPVTGWSRSRRRARPTGSSWVAAPWAGASPRTWSLRGLPRPV